MVAAGSKAILEARGQKGSSSEWRATMHHGGRKLCPPFYFSRVTLSAPAAANVHDESERVVYGVCCIYGLQCF